MSEFAAPMPVLARYAVMVDVGYIYAAAGELLFGTSARRDFRQPYSGGCAHLFSVRAGDALPACFY